MTPGTNEKDESMKALTLIVATATLAACAAQDTTRQDAVDEAVQAVRDLIEVRGLREVDKMASSLRDSWTSIESHFLIYKGRRESFLVEFSRRCYELEDDTRIIADERWDSSSIRARFDTIRGCRIHKLYALSEEDLAELQNIGESPGSRN
ncbi:MAG: DUF6491 family protein [Gammaproteobacteria bacterium]|nr:DUF6491 family protein [Gammaproteobacteria bacterium]